MQITYTRPIHVPLYDVTCSGACLCEQVQMTYTRRDGMKCLRVLSKSNQATDKREDMEEVRGSFQSWVGRGRGLAGVSGP